MSIPTFIDLQASDQVRHLELEQLILTIFVSNNLDSGNLGFQQSLSQCTELRQYLKELGADIEEVSDRGLVNDLDQIIKSVDVCLKEEKESDVESVLNSIVALLIQVPRSDPHCQHLISSFCKKLLEIRGNRISVILRV